MDAGSGGKPDRDDQSPNRKDGGHERLSGTAGSRGVDEADSAEAAQSEVQAAVRRAMRRWIEGCRDRLPGFVERTYGPHGALEIHRRAIGPDLLRTPANLLLALPNALLRLAADASRASGRNEMAGRLAGMRLFLESDVGREITWRLHADLLLLPLDQGDRSLDRDALLEEILAEPAVRNAISRGLEPLQDPAGDPGIRSWLADALVTYSGSRVAATDLANALVSSGIGGLLLRRPTPGMVSLGTGTAKAIAAKFAGGTLGAALGGGTTAKIAGASLACAAAGSLIAIVLVASTLSGVVTDPLQARLGLHQRRLRRLLNGLEARLDDPTSDAYALQDQYVARILDLVDAIATVRRMAA